MTAIVMPTIKHPKYDDLIMDVEKASIRQRVDRGYILVWRNVNHPNSEWVISWKIYSSRKAAIDAMTKVAATVK